MDALFTFFIGGARSGKSHLAQRLAEAYAATGIPVAIVVTAEAGDAEMAERIERHQDERSGEWLTVEAPRHLAKAIGAVPEDHVILLDCITLWVSNLILDDVPTAEIEAQAAEVAKLLASRPLPVVVVSNEVGHGLVPPDPVSRAFRDVHGRANRAMAQAADRSLLVVAGQALPLVDPASVLPELAGLPELAVLPELSESPE